MANKKEMIALLQNNIEVMRSFAQRSTDQVFLNKIEEQEKQLKAMLGEQKTLACDACKKVKTVSVKAYDFEKAKYFTCSHNQTYCPKCVRRTADEARAIRRDERAEKKKLMAQKGAKK